ncbi:MAG: hypothetical protein P8Y13_11850 [Deinococcales bacterium]
MGWMGVSAHGLDGGEAAGFEFVVDVAAAEVVDDGDVVAELAEVEAGGPAAEAVTAENEDLHAYLRASRRVPRVSGVARAPYRFVGHGLP